ncbi:MAG: hypothetical protein L6365_20160, partial [Desulfobulbaceae bacterium]|nr:hypothetical protein [Desulfobulbaceae bacterium]
EGMTLEALANPWSALSTEKQPCRRSRLLQTRYDILIGAAAGTTLDAMANPWSALSTEKQPC